MAMLAWLSLALPCAAAEPERWAGLADTVFRNYGTDDGLPHAGVNAITQDGEGFIWVGTQEGLARWDGYHFRVYRGDPSDPGALQDDFIWVLHADSTGRLWIGTNGGGLCFFDRFRERFVQVPLASGKESRSPVRSITDDGDGGLWVGTDDGASHLDADGQVKEHLLEGASVHALLHDRAGTLWAGTKDGLTYRDAGADSVASMPLGRSDLRSPAIASLFEDSSGRIWVGTDGHGAFSFNPLQRVPQLVQETDLDVQTVESITEIATGIVWLGTRGQGIVAIDTGTNRTSRIRHDAGRASSLPNDAVFALHRDRSGLLWAGTFKGMGLHDPSQTGALAVFGGTYRHAGFTDEDILSVLAARDGHVWLGLVDAGATIIDPNMSVISSLRPDKVHPQTSLPAGRVHALADAPDGTVYLGTSQGLYQSDLGGQNIHLIPISKEAPTPIVSSLFHDGTVLWIGTRGEGLWRLDNANSRPSRVAQNDLSKQWIVTIHKSTEDRLWIGTYQGLNQVNLKTGKVLSIQPDSKYTQSLSAPFVSAFLDDRQGRLWVATFGGGINILEGWDAQDQPRFHHIGIEAGLPDSVVSKLMTDATGRIWASTANGLAVIDPDSLMIRTLKRADGIPIRDFSIAAGATTSQGELLFGGAGGLMIVRPNRLASWDWRPPVVVTELRAGGTLLPAATLMNGLQRSPLEITPDANSLSVEFAALDYSAPQQNNYAYRMEGFNSNWIETNSAQRLAVYTNLPPGQYHLQLRGSNRNGLWTDAPLSIPVKVLPAWYQTTWFKTALTVAAICGIWLLLRSRTAYLRHRQWVLQQEVAQRTSELRLANTELETRTVELGQSLKETAESRAKVTSLLDNSGQGFLSFGVDLIVHSGHSRACAAMLGCAPAGLLADQILFKRDSPEAELFRTAIIGALNDPDSQHRQLLLSLLPKIVQRNGATLKIEYRPLDDANLMVVLTDVTEEQRLNNKLENERHRLAMIVSAVCESRDFFDAIDAFRQFSKVELDQILCASASPVSILQEVYRRIHTLKGTMAQFNLVATPATLHGLEEKLSEFKRRTKNPSVSEIEAITRSIDYDLTLGAELSELAEALGEDFLQQGKRIYLKTDQAAQLRLVAERFLAGERLDPKAAHIRQAFESLKNLQNVSFAEALAGFDRVIAQTADRLGKEVAPMTVVGGKDIWIDPEHYAPFLRSLVHVFRNSVAHGIEPPDEREMAGKDREGHVSSYVESDSDRIRLVISDDGAGIDIEALRQKVAQLGLMSQDEVVRLADEEVIDTVFLDEVSVRDRADTLSGRGVGLAAVRIEVQALGGEVTVKSTPGQGVQFTITLPQRDVAQTSNFSATQSPVSVDLPG